MRAKVDPDSPLAEWAVYFDSSLTASGRSAQTREVYIGALSQFDRFLVAHDMPRELRKIKRIHVEAFMQDQLLRLKPASANARYSGLRAFFKFALEEGEVAESPMRKMSPPKVPDPQVKSLSDDEEQRLLKACEGQAFRQRRDYALISFMLDTGARRAEAAHLKVADVDVEMKRAQIVRGKGGKDRVVVFSPRTALALIRYLNLRKKQSKAASPFLWLGKAGPLTPDAVAEIVARRARLAQITDHDGSPAHTHMLRHTWASKRKAAGMSEEDLMELGGWSTSEMLHRYGRDQRRVRALDAAQAFFEQAS